MELLEDITALLNFFNKVKYIVQSFANESGSITQFVNSKILQEWVTFKKFYIGDVRICKKNLLEFIEMKKEQLYVEYKYVLENKEWLCNSETEDNATEQTSDIDILGNNSDYSSQNIEDIKNLKKPKIITKPLLKNNKEYQLKLKQEKIKELEKTKKELEKNMDLLKQNIKDLERKESEYKKENNQDLCETKSFEESVQTNTNSETKIQESNKLCSNPVKGPRIKQVEYFKGFNFIEAFTQQKKPSQSTSYKKRFEKETIPQSSESSLEKKKESVNNTIKTNLREYKNENNCLLKTTFKQETFYDSFKKSKEAKASIKNTSKQEHQLKGPLNEDPLEGTSKQYMDYMPSTSPINIPNRNDPRLKTWNRYVKSLDEDCDSKLSVHSDTTPEFTLSDIELMDLTPNSDDSGVKSIPSATRGDDYDSSINIKKSKWIKPRTLFTDVSESEQNTEEILESEPKQRIYKKNCSEFTSSIKGKSLLKRRQTDENIYNDDLRSFYVKRKARIGSNGKYKSEYNLELIHPYDSDKTNQSMINYYEINKFEKTTITSEHTTTSIVNENKLSTGIRMSERLQKKRSLLAPRTITSELILHEKRPKAWIVPRKTPLNKEQYQDIVQSKENLPVPNITNETSDVSSQSELSTLYQKATVQKFFNLMQHQTEEKQENKRRKELLKPLLNYLNLSATRSPSKTGVRRKLIYDKQEPESYIQKQIKKCEMSELSGFVTTIKPATNTTTDTKFIISDLEIYDEEKALQKALQMSLDDIGKKVDVTEIGTQPMKKPIQIKDAKNFNPNNGDYKKYL